MEQILAVLTPYLATMRLGTVACKTAVQRPVEGGTNDRSVMSVKKYRKDTAVSSSYLADGGTSAIFAQDTAFSHR